MLFHDGASRLSCRAPTIIRRKDIFVELDFHEQEFDELILKTPLGVMTVLVANVSNNFRPC